MEKEDELRSSLNDKTVKFIDLNPNSKVFNSYNFSITQVQIQNEIQTELLELYIKKQN